MQELMRSNDPVLLSWVEATLAQAGIACVMLDLHTSVLEGSIGALPRRLMLPDADPAATRALLEAAAPEGVVIAGFAPVTRP